MKPEIKERIEKIKRGEIPEGYKKTKAGIAPVGWLCKKIKYLAKEVVAGATPSTKYEEYWNGHIPWMSSGEINNRFIKKTERTITKTGYENSSAKFIPPKSILVALAGQGQTRGRVAVNLIRLCTNQSLAAIIPNNLVDTYFLFYNLENRYNELRRMSTGEGGRGGLNLKIIKNINVNIMENYEEQQKIAQILSTWDKAIEIKEKLIEEKKKQKKGLMQLLLTGKKRLPGFKGEWKKVKISKILKESKVTEKNPDLEKLITVKLHLQGVLKRELLGNEVLGATKLYRRKKGQFIYGKQNFHNGALGIIPDELDGFASSSDIPAFDFIAKHSPKFFYYYWARENYYKSLEPLTTGTGSKRLNPKVFLNLFMLVPEYDEQCKIAEILKYIDRNINLLEQELEALKLQKKGLMQLLLTGIVRVGGDKGE